jgi:hypothetical protein
MRGDAERGLHLPGGLEHQVDVEVIDGSVGVDVILEIAFRRSSSAS